MGERVGEVLSISVGLKGGKKVDEEELVIVHSLKEKRQNRMEENKYLSLGFEVTIFGSQEVKFLVEERY